MSEKTPTEFMMIGLHKIAAERGDGLIPELLALYSDRQRHALQDDKVVRFPDELAAPSCVHYAERIVGNDNVIAFGPYLKQKVRIR